MDTPQGTDWFMHFRMWEAWEGSFITAHVLERGLALYRRGKNGDGIGEPVSEWDMPIEGQPCYEIVASDEFDQPKLGLQWQWQANPKEEFYSLTDQPGTLSCSAKAVLERKAILERERVPSGKTFSGMPPMY